MAKQRITTASTKPSSAVRPGLIIGLIVAVVFIVAGLVLLGNLNQSSSAPVDLSKFPVEGNPNAKVTILEYSDFGCIHCRDFNLKKLDQLKAEYIDTGKVKYVVHPFYLGNPDMELASEAALCANDQGKYFEYQRLLFENQSKISYDAGTLTDLGVSLGLDRAKLKQCLDNRTYQTEVENGRDAAAKRGVNSTPTFFVNKNRIEGDQPYETFKQVIEQELAIAQ